MDSFLADEILAANFKLAGEFSFKPGRIVGTYKRSFRVYCLFEYPEERIIYYLDPPEPYTGIAARIENSIGVITAEKIEIIAEPDVEYLSIICTGSFTSTSKIQAIEQYEQTLNINPLFDNK